MQFKNWTLAVGASNVLCRALIATGLLGSSAASASVLGDAIRALDTAAPLQRGVALKDLGITEPVVLAGTASHDFYFPVPRGIPLSDTQVSLDARYLNLTALPGSTSVVLALQGVPTGGQKITDSEGLLQRRLAVPALPRTTEFVRFGVHWKSKDALLRCEEDHSIANSLTIAPETRLNFRIPAGAIRSVEDAWSALPQNPTVLVADQQLDAASFDTAWRVVATLQRAGKHPSVIALPAVGSRFASASLTVPAALAGVPGFADLQPKDGVLEIADEAQAAAVTLLWLQQSGADMVIADTALQQKLAAMLEVLERGVAADSDAVKALQQLGAQRWPLASAALPSQQLSVTYLGRQPVLAVAADAGLKMAGLQENTMRRVMTSAAVTVPQAVPAQWDASQGMSLARLGSSGDSFEVRARGFWNANYPLHTLTVDGQVPRELSVYVAAAPGASATRPVATVYWNGVLLAAKQLQATGHPELLQARIPGYALGMNNALRVQVQRQPYSDDCNEIPQAYPVSVLPQMSYLQLGAPQTEASFVGILPLMSGPTQLFIPQDYLTQAPAAISRVATLAAASGMSISQAQLLTVQAQQSIKPQKTFLSMNVPVEGASSAVKVSDGGRLQVHGKEAAWLDVQGLQQLAAAEVVRAGGQYGIWWNAIGPWQGAEPEPFVLNRGNVAMVGSHGPLAWFDNGHPVAAETPGLLGQWRGFFMWAIPLLLLGLLALLILLALARRAKHKKQAAHG